MRANADLLKTNLAMTEKLNELTDVDFVRKHLQRHGMVAYLGDKLVEKRALEDVKSVMSVLHCDEKQATAYILRGYVGPEPTADEADSQ